MVRCLIVHGRVPTSLVGQPQPGPQGVIGAMQLNVTGKQIEIGEALRRHVEGSLGSILDKYFKTAIEAHVMVSKEAHLSRAEISIHIGRGIVVNARAAASEALPGLRRGCRAFGQAAAPVQAAAARPSCKGARAGRRRRAGNGLCAGSDRRGRRRGRRKMPRDRMPRRATPTARPAVIAEMSTELPNLTVGEAAMRMDLAEAPVLLFRNRSHGELNLVYRRADGNIGWIDPELDADAPNRLASHTPRMISASAVCQPVASVLAGAQCRSLRARSGT